MFPTVISQVDTEYPNGQLIEYAHSEGISGGDVLYTAHERRGESCRILPPKLSPSVY